MTHQLYAQYSTDEGKHVFTIVSICAATFMELWICTPNPSASVVYIDIYIYNILAKFPSIIKIYLEHQDTNSKKQTAAEY